MLVVFVETGTQKLWKLFYGVWNAVSPPQGSVTASVSKQQQNRYVHLREPCMQRSLTAHSTAPCQNTVLFPFSWALKALFIFSFDEVGDGCGTPAKEDMPWRVVFFLANVEFSDWGHLQFISCAVWVPFYSWVPWEMDYHAQSPPYVAPSSLLKDNIAQRG